MEVASEERTAHHVRRLHDSIRDLHNALKVVAKAERATRPPRGTITPDTAASDDPMSRIMANNQRGVVQRIERLQDIGAVVLGLQGIGSLIVDTLCRYGVKRLVVGDSSEIGKGDLDFMTVFVQDIGKTRDNHVAANARRLNPETDVFSLGLSLETDASLVIEALEKMLSSSEAGSSSSDEDASGESTGDDDSMYASSSDEEESTETLEHAMRRGECYDTHDAADQWEEQCFNVVFLCGHFPELAMGLNELCCEFDIQLVYVTMGKNGISGDTLSVVPGRSACLQCLEKRKVLKISGGIVAPHDSDANEKPTYNAGLPTTECVLAGMAVQHAVAHLLGAGPICSRVEYDGFLEEFDRSGFIAPVHQCPSSHCRQQQQYQQLQ